MDLHYVRTNLTNEPFSNPYIRKTLDKYINHVMYMTNGEAIMIDPFAREAFTNDYPNFITNDLNPEFNCNYNLEFLDFAQLVEFPSGIDMIVFDPPYNLRMLKDHYDGIGKDLKRWQTWNMWGEGKDVLARRMNLGSYAISFGFTSAGFGTYRGFEKIEIHILEQVAREDRYSLFMVVEKKVQSTLLEEE